ncbi:MAG: carboxypeptidase regulatory-like domain-containing protein [Acidobacteria bacterium]|nr:carboxypeptidase regulatory-like domain-containing protein [Acidobacteriota bacterium]
MNTSYVFKLSAAVAVLVLLSVAMVSFAPKVSAAAGGTINGTVKFSGTAPHMRGIDMSKDPVCSKAHASNPAKMENIVVGDGNGLENVVVYISEGLPAGAANAAPSKKPTYDQKGCMYVPHVLALNPDEKFDVTTSDPTTHNIHPLPAPGGGNIGWNKSQPPGAPPIESSWKNQEIAIPVKCNIHPWMHGFHVVVKGPFGQTDSKGSYSIENVPAGSYTLTAWQEELGTQTQKVTVAAGKPATADFTFKGK